MVNKKILLASKSPRRQELLGLMQIPFEVVAIDCDESFSNQMNPYEVAAYLSEKKSKAYTKNISVNEILLTSDTVVIVKNSILNKPENDQEAFEMIHLLSGKMHEVVSGFCLRNQDKIFTSSASTKVFFKDLSDDEIWFYIKNFKPFDKAGAYGIQEWIGLIGVQKIEGNYSTVVGLPSKEVYEAILGF